MASIVDSPELKISHDFVEPCHSVSHFPRAHQSIPEGITVPESEHFDPFESTRSLNDEVVLPVIDHHGNIEKQQVFNKMNLLFHEVFVEGLVNFIGLCGIGDIFVEFEPVSDITVVKERFKKSSGVVSIACDVIDVDFPCYFNDKIQSVIESVMKVPHVSGSFLQSSIEDEMLDESSLLVIDESHVVGILSNLLKDEPGVSESVSDCDSFESSDNSLMVDLLSFDVVGNSGSVFPCVAFSKDIQWFVSCNSQLLEAAFRV